MPACEGVHWPQGWHLGCQCGKDTARGAGDCVCWWVQGQSLHLSGMTGLLVWEAGVPAQQLALRCSFWWPCGVLVTVDVASHLGLCGGFWVNKSLHGMFKSILNRVGMFLIGFLVHCSQMCICHENKFHVFPAHEEGEGKGSMGSEGGLLSQD